MISDVEQITDGAFGEIDQCLRSRLEFAEVKFREAEEALTAERDALVAFHHDGTVSEQVARRVSVSAHDAASDAGMDVLAQRTDRSVFDQAKAARDALDAWLISQGLPHSGGEGTTPEPANEPDGKVARQLIADHFDACFNAARQKVGEARAGVELAREELAAFRRDRQISAEVADDIWARVAFAVTDVGMRVLDGRVDRAEFDQAKVRRSVVLEWLQEQGFRVDPSTNYMAELPG